MKNKNEQQTFSNKKQAKISHKIIWQITVKKSPVGLCYNWKANWKKDIRQQSVFVHSNNTVQKKNGKHKPQK